LPPILIDRCLEQPLTNNGRIGQPVAQHATHEFQILLAPCDQLGND
jgi:hypothetical protein